MRNFRQLVAVVVVAVPLVAVAEPPAASPADLDRWIADLGADDFRLREAATRELKRHPAVAPKLRAAVKSADKEAATRAAEILAVFAPFFREQAIRRIANSVKRGEVDVVAEQIVRFPCESGAEPPALWQSVLDLGWAARDDYAKRYKTAHIKTDDWVPPKRDITTYTNADKVPIARPDVGRIDAVDTYFYRGGPLQVGVKVLLPVLVADGPVDVRHLSGCVLLTNGPVTIDYVRRTDVALSVVFTPADIRCRTDRDVRAMEGVSLILVAGGDIRAPLNTSMSVILAAGDVYFPDDPGVALDTTVVRAGGKIHLPAKFKARNCDVQENVADPTAPFTFFSLARVGLTVAAVEGGVRVAKIDQKSPFAAAGVAAGDVIVAVDDAKVATPDDLKKRVRAGVARGDAEVRVRTGATVRDILVRFPE